MSNGDRKNGPVPATVTSIPLVDPHAPKADPSIGDLVKETTAQMSTLVRAEVELAKAELAGEAKKAGVGAGFFAVAGVVALYSSFFLFFFLAELIAEWLPRWAAFLIVFVLMLVIAGVAAFLGLQKVKKVGKPEKTIQSVQELKTVIPSSGNTSRNPSHATADGLYT